MKCHYKRESMPKTLIAKYNPPYDPNWKVGELVGAVMVSVPFETIILRAQLNGLIRGLACFHVYNDTSYTQPPPPYHRHERGISVRLFLPHHYIPFYW